MKKRIIIRILCLILCFSMLAPTVASATSLPELPYGPQKEGTLGPLERDFTLRLGKTTNEMAYVDRFFNHDGSYSDLGEKLKKWLDMTPKEIDSSDHIRSGYLMLERELDHHNSWNYKLSSGILYAEKFVVDVVSLNALFNEVADWISDSEFENKFPYAKKEAFPYYANIYQVLIDYLVDMQTALDESSAAWDDFSELVDGFLELSPNDFLTDDAPRGIKILCNKIPNRNIYIFLGHGKGAGKLLNVTQIKDAGNLKVTAYGDGYVDLKKYLSGHINGNKFVVVNMDAMDKTIQNQRLLKEFDESLTSYASGVKGLEDLQPKHIKGYIESINYAGLDDATKKRYNDAYEEVKDNLVSKKWKIDIPKYTTAIGYTIDALQITNSIWEYGESIEEMTALQATYLSAISQVSVNYLNMLTQWQNAVSQSDLDPDEIQAFQEAIAAVTNEGLDLYDKTADEVDKLIKEKSKKDGEYLAGEALGDVWKAVLSANMTKDFFNLTSKAVLSVVQKHCPHAVSFIQTGVQKARTALASAGKLGSAASKVGSKVSGFLKSFNAISLSALVAGIGVDLIGRPLFDFNTSGTIVYNMKWTLWKTLTEEETGLLPQYAKERTHEKAVEIIYALNAMKSLKNMGEDLVNQLYLYHFYNAIGVDMNGIVNTILWNQIMHDGIKNLDTEGEFKKVIAVYEKYKVKDTTAFWGERDATTILGLFSPSPSDRVYYNNKLLSSFNSIGNDYSKKEMKSYEDALDISGHWLTTGIMDTSSAKKIYKTELYIYSDGDNEILITEEEYSDYLRIEGILNQLAKKIDDKNDSFSKSVIISASTPGRFYQKITEEAEQIFFRMEWTYITKKWIEWFKMYDQTYDYYNDCYF